MAALTEKDLEQKRARNERLREQIADAEAKAAAVSQEQNFAVEGALLDAEAARLDAQLAAAKEAAKVSNIKAGAAGPLAAAEAQLAVAQGNPPPVVPEPTDEKKED